MQYPFFDEAVAEYIKDRLTKECEVHGAAAEIARRIGFTRAQISAIINGVTPGGPDSAQALAKYWGMSGSQLQQVAREAKRQREEQGGAEQEENELLPNLVETAEWCRGVYPDRFLDMYVFDAREQPNAVDRPKLVWLADIQAQCFRWIAEQATGSAKCAVLSQPATPERRNATVAMMSPVPCPQASDPDEEDPSASFAEKPAESKGVIRKERSGVQVSPKFKIDEHNAASGKAKAR